MQPTTTPIAPATVSACLQCDGPLGGNQLRCPDCVQAAEQAVREARGQVVRPSAIARARER